ncbi:MAG: hypothetical protein EOO88_31745 [Pedobacter sp.]|nr:MAG: hypothetical protein EOO88_31745 [Pedobacter sp.]
MAFGNTVLLCLLFILIGFSTWTMLPIRSNANVVINENKPSDAAEVLAYYNMEQYGERKVFFGPSYTEVYANLDPNKPYEDSKPNYERDYKAGKYVIVNNYKNAKQNSDDRHSGFFPRMSSDKSVTNYMSFNGPPPFRIDPAFDYTNELRNYGIEIDSLSDEEAMQAVAQIKGELEQMVTEFRTSYSSGKVGNEEYDKFLQSYKQYLIIEKPTFAENVQFMFEYQFGYMYWRYLMWNFVGKQNDLQGEYDNNGNWLSGITFIDEARLGPQGNLTRDMLNNKGRNTYYFLPFILGLIGAVYHARKDLKSFYIILAMFLFMSFALKIFLNERPFEVRERDYVLVGSFYAFAIWIVFGVYALYDTARKYIQPKIAGPLVLAATLLAGPVLLASQNWDDHDRSGRYTAVAMAKAYLDSCEPNAILFTIGDNDTFPLWYAQEIEGFRTDVRIVCITLLPTDWYIDQIKQKAYESDPVPISFNHSQYVDGTRDYLLHRPKTEERISLNEFIEFVSLDDERAKITFENGQKVNYYPTNKIRIPVDKNEVVKNKVVSPQRYDSIVDHIDIDLPQNAIYKHNLMMLDIINNNKWKRPIYFSGGSNDDENYIWMKDYLQLEGMVYKLVPVKTPFTSENRIDMGYVDSKKMYDIVMKWDWGNSGSTSIYHDPETRRNSINYRKNLARLVEALINEGDKAKARKVIDIAMKNMPVDYFGYYFIVEPFADGCYKTGDKAEARKLITTLMGKYKENLAYYKSLPASGHSEIYYEIVRDIESYRSLLLVMKDNGDMEFYNSAKSDFNKYNAMFPRFKRESE